MAAKRILTAEEFAELKKSPDAPVFPRRRNVALNKGGSVDIFTNDTEAVAVLRHAARTPEIEAEVTPLLARAAARLQSQAETAD